MCNKIETCRKVWEEGFTGMGYKMLPLYKMWSPVGSRAVKPLIRESSYMTINTVFCT